MDAAAAISLTLTVINFISKEYPDIVAAAGNLKTFGTRLFEEFTGAQISDDDLATLEAKVDELSAQLQQPLPPE